MTRHARYRQVGKPTIHKATIEIPLIKTPTIEDNRKVYKQIGILDKGFIWSSPRRWQNKEYRFTNRIFLFKGNGLMRVIFPKEG